MAKLHFKYGAMNSGKSDTLIKTAFNYEERGLTVVVVKPKLDTKGGEKIVARGGHERNVDILSDDTTDIESMIVKRGDVDCVLVDEAQFLSEAHISQLYRLAKDHNISIICHGLKTDFKSKLFEPGAKRLLEIADSIGKLPTMCFCGSQAEFNTRKVDGTYVFRGDQVAIEEGDVTYDSLCGSCYMKHGGKI